ncbi:hypothetical protein KC850_01745 [Candidatus Kaiserbacteria bacterium]|nr:hypothetical protein [Candidatus Kaiserbacteria bacterium]
MNLSIGLSLLLLVTSIKILDVVMVEEMSKSITEEKTQQLCERSSNTALVGSPRNNNAFGRFLFCDK